MKNDIQRLVFWGEKTEREIGKKGRERERKRKRKKNY